MTLNVFLEGFSFITVIDCHILLNLKPACADG